MHQIASPTASWSVQCSRQETESKILLKFVSKMHWNSPTCICQFKKFPGVIPRTPVIKGRGGKAKGRVGLEGMEGREWEGMKDEGEGRRGGEGREDSEGWCP
jgi:hypothetical protein